MCLQCLTHPWYYGEIAPGFTLARSTKENSDWGVGEWGLIECNDPSVVFKHTPYLESYSRGDLGDFYEAFRLPMGLSSRLLSALNSVQYSFAVRRLWVKHLAHSVEDRLYIYLAEFIKDSSPTQDVDPFPHVGKSVVYDPKCLVVDGGES